MKDGWAVIAMARMAPIATSVSPVAVLMGSSLDIPAVVPVAPQQGFLPAPVTLWQSQPRGRLAPGRDRCCCVVAVIWSAVPPTTPAADFTPVSVPEPPPFRVAMANGPHGTPVAVKPGAGGARAGAGLPGCR